MSKKYIDFELMFNGEVIDHGMFDTMESAKNAMNDDRLNLKPGLYTIINKETKEREDIKIDKSIYDFELNDGDEFINL
jgi:hypothetical protein